MPSNDLDPLASLRNELSEEDEPLFPVQPGKSALAQPPAPARAPAPASSAPKATPMAAKPAAPPPLPPKAKTGTFPSACRTTDPPAHGGGASQRVAVSGRAAGPSARAGVRESPTSRPGSSGRLRAIRSRSPPSPASPWGWTRRRSSRSSADHEGEGRGAGPGPRACTRRSISKRSSCGR